MMVAEGTGTTKKRRAISYYVHSVIVFLIMFVVGQLPPFGQITPLGMQILGIFVGVIYGWCTVSMVWPSLIGLIAIGSTDYCTITESFSLGFGDDLPLQIVAVYILGAYLEESGLLRYLCNWFISRKIGEGRPWVFTSLIFLAAFILASLVSVFFTIIIMWGIFYEVCKVVGLEKRSKYVNMVMCGIVIIAGLSGALFPFKPFSLMIIGLVEKGVGAPVEINFMAWTLYNTLLSLGFALCYMLIGRFIVRPDMTKVKEAGKVLAYLRNEKMNPNQKRAGFIFILFLLILIIPSFFSKEIAFVAWLSNAGVLGATGVCITLLYFLNNEKGEPVVNLPTLMNKGISWEVVILISATMPLAAALEAPEIGVMATVVPWMQNIFSSLSSTLFLVVFMAAFLIATQFLHNLILMIVFTPLLVKMGLGFGLSPILIGILIYFAAMTAYLTPAASSQAALVFGNSEWIDRKAAFFWGGVVILVAFVVLIGIGIPLGQLFF